MLERIAKIILWCLGIGWGCVFCWAFCRIFICDQFVVPSGSMEPSLIAGDRILANKLVFGARIYRNFNFGEGVPLDSWRMPRFRRIRPNDIVVFNAPHGYDRNMIEFKINYVYAKRCIGTPGDTIAIRDSRFYNNNYSRPIGDTLQQRNLAAMPDSLFSGGVMRAYPCDDELFGWTIKNMGPLYVPRRGDTVRMDIRNYKLYRMIIEYETNEKLKLQNDTIYLNNVPLLSYIFSENYYYFCGDNVANSKDSRYLGFVPEEFIIGVVRRISYSCDRNTDKFRWRRLWKKVTKLKSIITQ